MGSQAGSRYPLLGFYALGDNISRRCGQEPARGNGVVIVIIAITVILRGHFFSVAGTICRILLFFLTLLSLSGGGRKEYYFISVLTLLCLGGGQFHAHAGAHGGHLPERGTGRTL
jgi:hypothetical protein